jgi:hypothetical protein
MEALMRFMDEMIGDHYAKSKFFAILAKVSRFFHLSSPIILFFSFLMSYSFWMNMLICIVIIFVYAVITRILWVQFKNISRIHNRVYEHLKMNRDKEVKENFR